MAEQWLSVVQSVHTFVRPPSAFMEEHVKLELRIPVASPVQSLLVSHLRIHIFGPVVATHANSMVPRAGQSVSLVQWRLGPVNPSLGNVQLRRQLAVFVSQR